MKILSVITNDIDPAIELNSISDFKKYLLSASDFKHEDNRIRVRGNIDDLSLRVIDGDVESIEHEISNLRVAILRKLFLECL